MVEKPKERILILSVDRDNDVGEKASVSGPIVGKDKVLDAATKLGLADPQDSDFNAMFEAVRVFEEMRGKYSAEVAVVTGNKNVGVQSDKEITEQFGAVIKKFPADYVVLVTDGTEDEHVMPIIQSKVPILSVKRVVVKQAEQLESTYYKIKDFLEESLDNPKFARLVFGIPAIILLLIGIFGIESGRVILGVLGVYLFIKGFKLEHYIGGAWDELKTSFTRRRFAFFTYIVGAAFFVFASFRGWLSMEEWVVTGIFEAVAAFVMASVYFYFLGGAVAWVGRGVSSEKRNGSRIVAIPVFGLAISIVVYNAAELILIPNIEIMNFIMAVVVGFFLLFVALLIERRA